MKKVQVTEPQVTEPARKISLFQSRLEMIYVHIRSISNTADTYHPINKNAQMSKHRCQEAGPRVGAGS